MTYDKNDKNSKSVQLLESISCDWKCSDNNARRSFQLVEKGMYGIHQIKSPVGAAFLDINNDVYPANQGVLDVFVFYQDGSNVRTAAFMNKFSHDAYFFSVLVLNGLCLNSCFSENNTNTPYGVNYAGASLKHSIVDTDGSTKIRQSCQLPQQSYQSLLIAKNTIGIGRTNNYIQDLVVRVSRRSKDNFKSYQGIIPNSALVISPYQPDQSDVSSWRLELYMNPASTTQGILIVLGTTLCICGIIIWFLDLLERVTLFDISARTKSKDVENYMVSILMHYKLLYHRSIISLLENRDVISDSVFLLLSDTFGNPNNISYFLFFQSQECIEYTVMKLLIKCLFVQIDFKFKEFVF